MNETNTLDIEPPSGAVARSDVAQGENGVSRPFPKRERRRRFFQGFMFWLFRIAAAANGIALVIIVYFLVARGWRAINWTFLTQAPRVSDITAFFYLGKLIEVGETNNLFTRPKLKKTEEYITGRFG
jgi:hypothetical protein